MRVAVLPFFLRVHWWQGPCRCGGSAWQRQPGWPLRDAGQPAPEPVRLDRRRPGRRAGDGPEPAGPEEFATVACTGDRGRAHEYDLADSTVELGISEGPRKGQMVTLRQVTRMVPARAAAPGRSICR